MKIRSLLLGSVVAFAVAAPARAAETVSYTYDALGRITASTTSGGPNSGMATGTTFDAAGNRASYTVTGASAALQMTPFAGDRELARLEPGQASGTAAKGPARPGPAGF
jgi:hypothetical protein